MKRKITIAIIIALVIFAGIRISTSCYENEHRRSAKTVISRLEMLSFYMFFRIVSDCVSGEDVIANPFVN